MRGCARRLTLGPPLAHACAVGLGLLLTVGCGGASEIAGPTVASVVVTPVAGTLVVGETLQFAAIAHDASGTALANRHVVWTTGNPSVATVTSAGLVAGLAPGSTGVQATVDGIAGTATLTILVPVGFVEVAPATDSLFPGATLQMSATVKDAGGNPLDGRVVIWTTSDPSHATVSASGLVSAVSPGAATIRGMSEGKSDSATITVLARVASVDITPSTGVLSLGETLQLVAFARDASSKALQGRVVSWSTSDATRASVSSSGLVTAVAPGPVTISGTSEGKTGTSALTVQNMTAVPLEAPVRDIAFDAKRNLLYLAEPAFAQVGVFSLSTLSYGAAIPTGANRPTGLDLSISGDSLIVSLPEAKALGIINLASKPLVFDTVHLNLNNFLNRRPDGVRVLAGSRVIIAATFDGSGFGGQVLDFDLTTRVQRLRTDVGFSGSVTEATRLARSVDRQKMLLLIDDNCCPVTGFVYTAQTDLFSTSIQTVNRYFPAVSSNQDGSRFLIGSDMFTGTLTFLQSYSPPGYTNGPTALSADGLTGYFATSSGVVFVRLSDGTVRRTVATPTAPTALFALPNSQALLILANSKLYVLGLP